ncbi:MAG: hypothetical protein MO853_08605 [Candidatus Protistobacter heckmanni]|nr:hypothetical protein [Candidatus Protistobacter heckmanni]
MGLAEALNLAVAHSYSLAGAKVRMDSAAHGVSTAVGNLLLHATLRSSKGTEISSPASLIDENTGVAVPKDRHYHTALTTSVMQTIFDASAFAEIKRTASVRDAATAAVASAQFTNSMDLITAYYSLIQNSMLLDLSNAYVRPRRQQRRRRARARPGAQRLDCRRRSPGQPRSDHDHLQSPDRRDTQKNRYSGRSGRRGAEHPR